MTESENARKEILHRTAYHEAGHAVAACILHGGLAFLRVWIERWPDTYTHRIIGTFGGKVEQCQRIFWPGIEEALKESGNATPGFPRRAEIILNLAGPVAEAMFLARGDRSIFLEHIEQWSEVAALDQSDDDYSDAERLLEAGRHVAEYIPEAEAFLAANGVWDAVLGVAKALIDKRPTMRGRHVLSFSVVESIAERHVARPWGAFYSLPVLAEE